MSDAEPPMNEATQQINWLFLISLGGGLTIETNDEGREEIEAGVYWRPSLAAMEANPDE